MRAPILAAVLLGLGLLLPSTAAPRAAEDRQPTTAKLIEQLGSDDFDEREKATRMLLDRGPAALPALRKAQNHADAEVRRRVQELVATLEVAAALEPKRVTLKVEKKPLSVILAEIRKQTGYRLELSEADDGTLYSFEMKNIPFWEAVERVARETGRVVHLPFLERGIQLKRSKGRSPFVAVNGPFRLEVTRFHEDRDIDFTRADKDSPNGTHDHVLTLSVSVLAEPKFLLLGVEPGRVQAATDEDKKSLSSAPPREKKGRREDVIREGFRRDFEYTAEVLLRRSSDKAKTIKLLRGTIPVTMVIERKSVVVSENVFDSKGTKFEIGGTTLEVTRIEKDGDKKYTVALRIPIDRGQDPSLRWTARIHLTDAKGNRLDQTGEGSTRDGEDFELWVHFSQPDDPAVGPPARLIIEDWVTIQHLVPFEFKDVPLP